MAEFDPAFKGVARQFRKPGRNRRVERCDGAPVICEADCQARENFGNGIEMNPLVLGIEKPGPDGLLILIDEKRVAMLSVDLGKQVVRGLRGRSLTGQKRSTQETATQSAR